MTETAKSKHKLPKPMIGTLYNFYNLYNEPKRYAMIAFFHMNRDILYTMESMVEDIAKVFGTKNINGHLEFPDKHLPKLIITLPAETDLLKQKLENVNKQLTEKELADRVEFRAVA